MPSLFICVTPLQMLIAEKIIDKTRPVNIEIIVLAYQKNDKYMHYIKRLEKKCTNFTVLAVTPKNKLVTVIAFAKSHTILNKNMSKTYSEVYLSSIDNKYVQLIVSKLNYARLYTFDDGTANIIKSSAYYQEEKKTLKTNILRWIFGINKGLQEIKSEICKHYTIYPGVSNIVSNTELIEMFTQCKKRKQDKKVVRVFIGQPFDELGIPLSLIEEFFFKYKMDYYYPHPREKIINNKFTYIHSHLIFEEYIIEGLQHQDIIYKIYGAVCTSILNLASSKNDIEICSIYTDELRTKYSDYYTLAEKMNITLLKLT